MSGHSKWHNIQAKKGKADKARSNIFTKMSRMISVVAQQGGGDPMMNFSLRLAIDKAKAVNMPKDNIDRAIKRGTGEDSEGTVYQELLYEGFGPNGVAFLVEVLTDNNNRTVAEVKNAFTKNGGTMGGQGSVKWQFEQKGVIRFTTDKKTLIKDWEKAQLELLDAGVLDIKEDENGVELFSAREDFQKMSEVVDKLGIEPDESGLEWIAKETVSLDEETSAKVENLYNILDELDDVRAVYTNEE
ncbi:MAG TPA: YebC/PmpR family DNA-binding transcriptional regulator [Candidatus Magasanikbacteria bacterium]|jgi:YebC/PmpR family DNA-binding regulatory protein|nr:YebC/PmpR family DNA-binding transcriptional regulator [Candidatus Magasanikbacteria bacterium]HQL52835.1 YebC/PmpR family DNA-binding transcriptional regulator [Candidatus Magasanikbacteria bacterium]